MIQALLLSKVFISIHKIQFISVLRTDKPVHYNEDFTAVSKARVGLTTLTMCCSLSEELTGGNIRDYNIRLPDLRLHPCAYS